MNTGELIKSMRVKKGLTQDELAERTGITVRTIQRIEQGKVNPRSYSIKVIATALNVDSRELVDSSNEDNVAYTNGKRIWLPLLHLSGLFLLLIPTMIIWAYKRDEVDGMKEAGAQVINFQLTMLAVLIPSGVLAFTMVTIPVCIFIGTFSTVVIIINTILAIAENPYRYPLTYQFIKP
ncbi:MAG: hypothetical protein DI539_26210 [Flavobacterium psychrophilum]|nr:MAG: hypothetical protein DI539_26210 [Flavobacterium psychrophilum]